MHEEKTEIAFTKVSLPNGWLCNMSPHLIECFGKTWRTSEALFQALRFKSETIREEIRLEKSPMGAKMKAKSKKDLMAIKPMGVVDLRNMEYCLLLKVNQHPDLKQALLDTGNARIIEDVTSRGRRGSNLFWGALRTADGWEGSNMLGVLWMRVREKLRMDAQDELENLKNEKDFCA